MAKVHSSSGHGDAAAANGKSDGHAGAKDGVLAPTGANMSIRAIRYKSSASVQENWPRPVLPLAHGDPSVFPASRTDVEATGAKDGVLAATGANMSIRAIRSLNSAGLPYSRSAVAERLSQGMPYKLSAGDIFLVTVGAQAIEVLIPALAQIAGANILLPRQGYQNYKPRAAFNKLEVRYFDLIPNKGWEIDLGSLESVANKNTIAMVIRNPYKSCGDVYSYEHLAKVAEVARKLGILIIADEVHSTLVLNNAQFIPMGRLGHIAPVLSIGSLPPVSIVPRQLGWVAVHDPMKILEETKIIN